MAPVAAAVPMLTDSPVIAVVTTTDAKRSKDFYEQKIGLKPATGTAGEFGLYQCGNGTLLQVYERDAPPKAENTAVGFAVKDIEQVVAKLRKNGVTFEEYDTPEIKTVEGVATGGPGKAAWFKDPDGNIIALYEMPI